MSEAKLMPEFEQHPKVESCDLTAVGLFALGLSFAVRELTDGFIPIEWAEKKTNEPAGGRSAQQLVDEGLWEPVEGGYAVHDFTVYNPTRALLERREKERDKKRRQRLRGQSPGTVPSPGDSPPGQSPDGATAPHGEAVSGSSNGLNGSDEGIVPELGGTIGGETPTNHLRGFRDSTSTETVQPPSVQLKSSAAVLSAAGRSASESSTAPRSTKQGTEETKVGNREYDADWDSWMGHYRITTGNTKVRGSRQARRSFDARRREGRSLEELKQATVGNHSDDYLRANGWDVPETILRESKIDRYIVLGEEAEESQTERIHPGSQRVGRRLGRKHRYAAYDAKMKKSRGTGG